MGHDNVKDLLKVAGTILGAAPVVGGIASAIVDATIQIVEIADAAENNKRACIELKDTAAEVTAAMAAQVRTSIDPQKLEDNLQKLRLAIMDVNKCIEDVAGRKSFLRRMLNRSEDKEKIERTKSGLERVSRLFMLEAATRHDNAFMVLTNLIIRAREADALKSLTESLKPLGSAIFNAHDAPRGCFAGTRVDLLTDIDAWAADTSSPAVFWLAGLAGTGKSAIAYSVSHRLHARGALGASFFFKAGVAFRSDTSRVIPTIAVELASHLPDLCGLMNKAVSADSLLHQRNLETQIAQLIDTPMRMVGSGAKAPVVIVIDALDECDNNAGQLITLLASKLPGLHLPIKLFVTSRPEVRVSDQLASCEAGEAACRSCNLLDLDANGTASEVRTYLQQRLQVVAKEDHELKDKTWPSEHNLDQLVERAGGFFLYVFTVIEYVAVRGFSPQERLAHLLRRGADTTTPLKLLDDTYLDILLSFVTGRASDSMTAEDIENLCKRFQDVVGAIINLEQSLSVPALSLILKISESDVRRALEPLHRVVMVVPDTGSSTAVTFFHQSFPEFLQHHVRCKDARFRIGKWSDVDEVQGWIDKLNEALSRLALGTPDYDEVQQQARRLSFNFVCLPPTSFLGDRICIEQQDHTLLRRWGTFDVHLGLWRSGRIAVKILRKRWRNENEKAQLETLFSERATFWKTLAHPSLVPFLGIASSGVYPFCLVRPWMPNGCIKVYLDDHPAHRRLPWLSDMCAGLGYLHALNIVHGNIRPVNVLIDEDLTARISDIESGEQYNLDAPPRPYVPLEWPISPEICRVVHFYALVKGKSKDIYSLAMIWWDIYAIQEPTHSIETLFGDWTYKTNIYNGFYQPERPATSDPDGLSDALWELMQNCWKHYSLQPELSAIADTLRSLIQEGNNEVSELP